MNSLPYREDVACDVCGFMGSYDVMGDNICEVCFSGRRNCGTCKHYRKKFKRSGLCDYHYIEVRDKAGKTKFRYCIVMKSDLCEEWGAR